MRKHKHFLIFGNVLVTTLLIIVLGLFFIFGPPEKVKAQKMLFVPEEFVIYQDYLEAIGGKPEIYDYGIVEATLTSLNKSEICPSQKNSKQCNIEPYPNDWGDITINKIVSYKTYPKENLRNSGLKVPDYEKLETGESISTHFLLTTRPTKVQTMGVYVPSGPKFTKITVASNSEFNSKTSSAEKFYKPIPKQGNKFILTTNIFYQEIDRAGFTPRYEIAREKNLPGLKTGDKFRAKIYYNGTLFVEEYEII